MIQQEFVPYDLAIQLKELGFDEGCFGYYSKDIRNGSIEFRDDKRIYRYTFEETIPAPTFSQAFRLFREKYCLQHEIIRAGSKHWLLTIIEIDKVTENNIFNGNRYEADDEINPNTYEEAELACLKKLIEIIKKK